MLALVFASLSLPMAARVARDGRGPAQVAMRSEQEIPIQYNQGIARIDGGWVLSGTNSPLPDTDVLVRTDEQFHVVAANKPAIPSSWRSQGYDHIGDIDVVGQVIYAPFEQSDYSKGHQVTARYDAVTLRFMDAVVLPQHENSFVSVDPASMIAYSMDHFDGNSLLRYDVRNGWKPLPPLPMSALLHHTQGASIRDGSIWICTSDDHNGLYRVSLASGKVDNVGQLGHPGGEGEGIDATPLSSGDLHAMIIDPTMTKVWVQHFGPMSASPPTPPSTSAKPARRFHNRADSLSPVRVGIIAGAAGLAILVAAWLATGWRRRRVSASGAGSRRS